MLIFIGFIVILFSVIYAVLAIWHDTRNGTIDQTKQETTEKVPVIEEPKTRTVHKTGFPIAGGILTIIAASITFFVASLAVVEIVSCVSAYYIGQNIAYVIFVVFVGIWSFLAFGLGLAGGIFSIRRSHFALSIVGISLLLVTGLVSILEFGILGSGWSSGMIMGIPIIILTILSLIFVGVSKNEFI